MAQWTLKRLERAVENFTAQLQCSICLCSYENPVSLPCNHCFCEECIHRALEVKVQCPICKMPTSKRCLRYDTTVQELLRATEILCAAPVSFLAAVDHQVPIKVEKQSNKDSKQPSGETKLLKTVLEKTEEKHVLSDMKSLRKQSLANGTDSQLTAVRMSSTIFDVSVPKDAQKRKLTSSRRRSNIGVAAARNNNTSTALDESHFKAADRGHQTFSKRRRRSSIDGIASDINASKNGFISQKADLNKLESSRKLDADADVVVAETQLDEVENEQQEASPRRQRTTADNAVETKLLTKKRRQLSLIEAAANDRASEIQVKAVNCNQNSPTARKRRQFAKTRDNAATNKVHEPEVNTKQHLAVNKVVTPRGKADFKSRIDNQAEPTKQIEAFEVGDLVDVIERQWIGINRRGGAARITKVYADGFYGVKFVIGSNSDNRVPGSFIQRPTEDLVSDSTPSRAVRKRQRRQFFERMTSSNSSASKGNSCRQFIETKHIKTKHAGMVFLCSGLEKNRIQQILKWAELLKATVVRSWSKDVTHLIVKCVSWDGSDEGTPLPDDSRSERVLQDYDRGNLNLPDDSKCGRWVKIRSLKYLKALVGGRWIVSDYWLQACANCGGYVSELKYEVDGHWKGRTIKEAVKRSRLAREKLLQLAMPDIDHSNIGTMLFAGFCFHVTGDFLSPMPPISELNTLIMTGGGKLIAFLDEIFDEMQKLENSSRKLIIVSDKINPLALRQQAKQLTAQLQINSISSPIIVNYLWLINSISEAKLRELC
ncbi:hypothetical protein CCR75_004470 [Bremia lactucae]|uniref:RING-type E3 ubiquitin transferase BRCA1 n=1 Tax=Bremia lactucae TaxID=4779 RepID=A0A976IDV3_BRELC|nr:hypothetical protein CCR75_004470 [Bremia lactucae]